MGNRLKKILLNFVLPVGITIIILSFFLQDISFNDIKNAFLGIPITWILVFVLFSLVGTFLRALRYGILISHKLGFFDVFLITLVRNFAVDLLPARSAALVFLILIPHCR